MEIEWPEYFSEEHRAKAEVLFEAFQVAAHTINECLPKGRYRTQALTRLEEALLWANNGLHLLDGNHDEEYPELPEDVDK